MYLVLQLIHLYSLQLAFSSKLIINTSEIKLKSPEFEFHASTILDPSSKALTVVSNSDSNIRFIDDNLPMVFVQPGLYATNPEWGFSKNQSNRLITLSHSRGLVTILFLQSTESNSHNPQSSKNSLALYKEPNPNKNAGIYPQTVIFLKDYSNQNLNHEFFDLCKFRFMNNFITAAKPIVFILNFVPTQRLDDSTNTNRLRVTNGSLLCTFCRRYAYFTGLFMSFSCTATATNKPCWQSMEAIKSATLSPKWFRWDLLQAPDDFIRYRNKAKVKSRLFWHLQPVTVEILNYVQSDGNVFIEADRRFMLENRFTVQLTLERALIPEDEFLFVTSERIKSQHLGVNTFLYIFDHVVLSLLVTMVVISCLLNGGERATAPELDAFEHFRQAGYQAAFIYRVLIDQHSLPRTVAKIQPWRIIHTVAWVTAIFALSNVFKATITSNMVVMLPYETEIKGWRELDNFSLYGFIPQRYCSSPPGTGHFKRVMLPTKEWEDYIQREAQGSPNSENCNNSQVDFEPIVYVPGNNTRSEEELKDAMSQNSFTIMAKKMLWRSIHCTERARDEFLVSRCAQDWRKLTVILNHYALICPGDMGKYVGKSYIDQLDSFNKLRTQNFSQWNIKYTKTTFGGKNYTFLKDQDSLRRLYWLTRKRQVAFVMHKSEFPYYWSLFRKAMEKDPSLKFAHTGDQNLMRNAKSKRETPSPLMFVRGPLFKYQPEVERYIRKLQSLITFGLIQFWGKWEKILRPPTTELNLLNSVDGPEAKEVVPIALNDGAANFSFRVMLIGVVSALVIFLVEILVFYGVPLVVFSIVLRLHLGN